MPSSSGGDSHNLGQKPSTIKIKNNRTDSEWKQVDYTKNRKSKTSVNTSNPSSPIPPSLKQILDNPPTLCMNTNNQSFNYENTASHSPLSTDINVSCLRKATTCTAIRALPITLITKLTTPNLVATRQTLQIYQSHRHSLTLNPIFTNIVNAFQPIITAHLL
ncbi:hypothetical protein QTP88_023359 [Uroleucon formosanum]